jgi:hypothetical protein
MKTIACSSHLLTHVAYLALILSEVYVYKHAHKY